MSTRPILQIKLPFYDAYHIKRNFSSRMHNIMHDRQIGFTGIEFYFQIVFQHKVDGEISRYKFHTHRDVKDIIVFYIKQDRFEELKKCMYLESQKNKPTIDSSMRIVYVAMKYCI